MKLCVYVGYWGLGMGPQDQLQVVQEAERLGYDSVWAYLDGQRQQAGQAIPDELIDIVSLYGPREVVRDRLAAFRDACVGTLMVTPMAFTAEDRIVQLRAVAELAA